MACIALVVTAIIATALPVEAGSKKQAARKDKKPLMCRIPIIKRTPLCPDYNREQIDRLSPRIPEVGR
jgi:hypothetical protein